LNLTRIIGPHRTDGREDVVGRGENAGRHGHNRTGSAVAGEARREEAETDQGDRRHRLAQAAHAGERGSHGFEEQSPRTLGLALSARRPALNGGEEVGPAIVEQEVRNRLLAAIESGREGALLIHLARAFGAAIDVLFDAVFFVGVQFAVIVKRYQFRNRIARHTKSPKTARIFCVARKRQFLAASSVVPSISPMFRNRSPW
jgi:hypothetical protein